MTLATVRMMGATMKKRQYPISVLALAVLALVIMIYGLLAGLHADVGSYVTFVAPIVTTLLGLTVISRQIDDVRDTASKVEEQTNGKLTARLNDVKEELKAHVDAAMKDSNNE